MKAYEFSVWSLYYRCTHGRRSVGDGGDASPPHFSGWGDSKGIVPPPNFLVQKNCEAYNLTQQASLLKAAT